MSYNHISANEQLEILDRINYLNELISIYDENFSDIYILITAMILTDKYLLKMKTQTYSKELAITMYVILSKYYEIGGAITMRYAINYCNNFIIKKIEWEILITLKFGITQINFYDILYTYNKELTDENKNVSEWLRNIIWTICQKEDLLSQKPEITALAICLISKYKKKSLVVMDEITYDEYDRKFCLSLDI